MCVGHGRRKEAALQKKKGKLLSFHTFVPRRRGKKVFSPEREEEGGRRGRKEEKSCQMQSSKKMFKLAPPPSSLHLPVETKKKKYKSSPGVFTF